MLNVQTMPQITMPRYRSKLPFKHHTSFNHGELIPIDALPILPGTGVKVDFYSLIRMSTPIAPIMDDIEAYVYCFFVPMRLVWNHTREFFGENLTNAGPQSTIYTIPQAAYWNYTISQNSVSHYLGKPVHNYNANPSKQVYVSTLKERAYWLIADTYFRAQQVEDPIIVSTIDSGNSIASQSGVSINLGSTPYVVNKKLDTFTTSTISPVYGSQITIPLGTTAPVTINAVAGVDNFITSNGVGLGDTVSARNTAAAGAMVSIGANGSNLNFNTASIKGTADLSNAVAATLNSLYYSMAVQKYLSKSNMGTRFYEMLQVHYGTSSPDASLQIPERLGGAKFRINIDQVLSTAGYSASASTEVGQPGAVSVTPCSKTSLCVRDFGEPGYLLTLIETKHDESYSQGLLKEDIKSERYEIFSPEFSNLGEDTILKKQLYVSGTSSDDDVFGYQEHWYEYRYRHNRVSGLLDPAVTGSLDFWTLSNKFGSQPSLNSSFLKESRSNLARALVTGNTGPDYLADFFIDYTITSEVPPNSFGGIPFNGRF